MARRPSFPGLFFALLGALALAASFLPHGLGPMPAIAGGVLFLLGVILLVASLGRVEAASDLPPAHVTFYQQNRHDLPIPQVPQALRTRAASPGEEFEDLEPVSGADLELHSLEVKIRDLNRKINKATVMLGTGKLSDEGYRRYVEDLKGERADLEAKRVQLEMTRADP